MRFLLYDQLIKRRGLNNETNKESHTAAGKENCISLESVAIVLLGRNEIV
jgi:hypothetical protein